MSPSLALSLSLLPRRALPLPPLRLASKHPPLSAHQCHLLVRTPKRPLPAPRLLLAPRASASAAASPAEPAREGSAAGRKTAWYWNRFLDLARLGAEAFFRSEIQQRLAVTAALIVLNRVGYFVPLPGFDQRLIPDSYLSFALIPADDLGDFSSELKLSFFQLGISHQISASIVMQLTEVADIASIEVEVALEAAEVDKMRWHWRSCCCVESKMRWRYEVESKTKCVKR